MMMTVGLMVGRCKVIDGLGEGSSLIHGIGGKDFAGLSFGVLPFFSPPHGYPSCPGADG